MRGFGAGLCLHSVELELLNANAASDEVTETGYRQVTLLLSRGGGIGAQTLHHARIEAVTVLLHVLHAQPVLLGEGRHGVRAGESVEGAAGLTVPQKPVLLAGVDARRKHCSGLCDRVEREQVVHARRWRSALLCSLAKGGALGRRPRTATGAVSRDGNAAFFSSALCDAAPVA